MDKTNECVALQTQLALTAKKLSKENNKMDEMWAFVSRSFYMLTRGMDKRTLLAAPAHHPGMMDGNGNGRTTGISASPSASTFDPHASSGGGGGGNNNNRTSTANTNDNDRGGSNGNPNGSNQHERILMALIKEVIRKYPALAGVAKASATAGASRASSRARLNRSHGSSTASRRSKH